MIKIFGNIPGAKHAHQRCPLVGKYSISSLETPHQQQSLSARNRKWTHEPTPIKSTSLINNDCASTFLADDDHETLLQPLTKTPFSTSDTKSYLMFGCAGESKFRLLNSCVKQRNPYTNKHTSSYKSGSNSEKRHSVISSPLKISNEKNFYGDSSLSEIKHSGGSEDGVIEGKLYKHCNIILWNAISEMKNTDII